MALVEVGHDDTLPLRHGSVDTDELAILAHRVDLMQRELVLDNYSARMHSQSSTGASSQGRGRAD